MKLNDTAPSITINIGTPAEPAPVDPNSPEGRGAGSLSPSQQPAKVPALHVGSSPHVEGRERHRDGRKF